MLIQKTASLQDADGAENLYRWLKPPTLIPSPFSAKNKLILKRFLLYCEIKFGDSQVSGVNSDTQMLSITREIFEFFIYIRFYDYRNFPEFPVGENSYIPGDSYFLMGDNRYNSMDFRYLQDGYYFKKIYTTDSFSFIYRSQMNPHLLKEEKILGIVVGRLWPPDRFGLIR